MVLARSERYEFERSRVRKGKSSSKVRYCKYCFFTYKDFSFIRFKDLFFKFMGFLKFLFLRDLLFSVGGK